MKLYRFLLICAAAVTAACTEEPRDFDMTPAAPPAPEEQYAAPTNPLGSIVVAHRGGATESGHPDNSLAGLKYALDLKVYAVECDIYATADNRVIVAHATPGCLVNGLKPWEHTYDELCAAGTLSNGERLPLLEDFLEEVMRAGTSKLWLDVKNILVDGSSAGYTGFSARSCQLACQVIERMKARNFVEFIVTSNKTVWTLCYSAAQSAGVRAGWMGYVAPAEYQTYIDPWINIDASNIWFDGTAGSGQWGIDDYASAGVEVSVFTIDKDVDAAYYANYIDRLRAIATNYPKKLIGTFRK